MTELAIHPAADVWPMLPDDELEELADSIRDVGLLEPLVRWADPETGELYLLDGRNRYAACQIAGVEPEWVDYQGDPLKFVVARNARRRMVTTGAKAMAVAVMYAGAGLRRNGRWQRGAVDNGQLSTNEASAWIKAMKWAGTIIDHAPDQAPLVIRGTVTLNAAYSVAISSRDAAASEEARMSRLAAAAPDLAAQVRDGALTISEADAAAEVRHREWEQAIARDVRRIQAAYTGWNSVVDFPRMSETDRDAILEQLTPDERAWLTKKGTR